MRRLIVSVAVLCIIAGPSKNAFSQSLIKPKGKFILGVYENAIFVKGGSPKHDHLSFTAAFVNGKRNHHELSLNSLSTGKNRFKLGLGYQYKWQWLKKLPIHPYIGIYNNVNFNSENILSEEGISDYSIALESGVAPGINASIGKLYIDGSIRLAMMNTAFSKGNDISLQTIKDLDTQFMGFKQQLGLRVGVGFKF